VADNRDSPSGIAWCSQAPCLSESPRSSHSREMCSRHRNHYPRDLFSTLATNTIEWNWSEHTVASLHISTIQTLENSSPSTKQIQAGPCTARTPAGSIFSSSDSTVVLSVNDASAESTLKAKGERRAAREQAVFVWLRHCVKCVWIWITSLL